MKNALFALAVLVPALAHADDGRNRPYVLINGRSAGTAAAPAPKASAPEDTARPTAAAVPNTFSGGGVSASGIQTMVGRRSLGGHPQGHKSLAPADLPAYATKPGALIRTEGQQPQYANAAPAREHKIDGGSFITIDDKKALDVGRSRGPHEGPKDAAATPNAASGSRTRSGNSVTPNSGGDNGHGHDNGFGGGTGFDPAF